jgi:3-isopropylmalate/(R)-2-methylmalate dehydratase large subunit
MEFVGSGLENLSMDDRFAMANMVIEAGAKNGIFLVDEKTKDYIRSHKAKTMTKHKKVYAPDQDAEYEKTISIDLSTIRPTVSFPHLPDNTKTIDEAGGVRIDQSIIGSCTNGRLEDMAVTARILKGRKVASGVRCIIFPGTQQIYLDCVKLGYAEIFVEAGAVLSTPTCGPCLGGHMGILAAGEKAVSTTNRNFVGRMGHVESEVYLASPAVAAASAVTGELTDPAKL